MAYLNPVWKLTIGERTNFLSSRQNKSESVSYFVTRLRVLSQTRMFESLILSHRNWSLVSILRARGRILQTNEVKTMFVTETLQFIQRHEEIREFFAPERPSITFDAVKARPRQLSTRVKSQKQSKLCGSYGIENLMIVQNKRWLATNVTVFVHCAQVCRSKITVHN